MDAQALHHFLLDAGAYPEGEIPCDYQETHVSRLYFTSKHVYKFKKPVDFGFLNFSTLERRLFFCEEEIRLNRRLCPDIYLGVVELRRLKDRFVFGQQGEIVDYAVLMKRLPSEKMLDSMIERRELSLGRLMADIAVRLAEFHEHAEICRRDGGQTNLEVVQINWRENFLQTAPFADKTVPRGALEQMRIYVSDYLEKHGIFILRREEQGFVRDGHGDLHTEHICLTDPICIYDCIEFNRRFRVADVAADLAFLLMDLDYRGRRDLAEVLMETYLESRPDPELPGIVTFYKIYRAWVRGKVESFLAADDAAGPDLRKRAEVSARSHFNLALGYLAPNILVITCGLMGTGKSTLAAALARATGARLLRSDVLRKELAGLSSTRKAREDFGRGIYQSDFTARTYDLLLQKAVESMERGRSAIVDASFSTWAERERFRQAAMNYQVPFFLLEAACPEETALRRLDLRESLGVDVSDGRRELYHEQAAQFQHPGADEEAIRVDTSGDVDYNVGLALCRILEKTGIAP